MASYRQIHTKIWKDGWFLDLPPDCKLLFVYLFSNERANLLGLYDLPMRVIAFETGLELDTVEWGMNLMQEAGKVIYDNGWVWVTNLLRYNATNKDSPKIQAHILNTLDEIPDCHLKRELIAYYAPLIPYLYGMIPNRTEQEQEHEHEQDRETETEQEQTPDADAVAVLKGFGMGTPAKVLDETRLTPSQVIETVRYAEQEGLKPGWVRKQLRDNNAHRPRAPDNNNAITVCPTCSMHPCDCEEAS